VDGVVADVVAVVPREEDDRLPREARPVENLEETPDIAVHGVDARQVVAGPLLHLRRVEAAVVRDRGIEVPNGRRVGVRHWPVRQVRGTEVQQQGEGFALAFRHEANGLVGQQVRERALQGLLAALDLERRVHGGVPAVEEAEEALEAEGRGVRPGPAAEVPLADEGGAPALLAQNGGPGRRARRQPEAGRRFVRRDPVPDPSRCRRR
jgi:hypothetical protein